MREENIIIKVTPEEKEKIKAKAREEGMTVSGYIRFALLRKGR